MDMGKRGLRHALTGDNTCMTFHKLLMYVFIMFKSISDHPAMQQNKYTQHSTAVHRTMKQKKKLLHYAYTEYGRAGMYYRSVWSYVLKCTVQRYDVVCGRCM